MAPSWKYPRKELKSFMDFIEDQSQNVCCGIILLVVLFLFVWFNTYLAQKPQFGPEIEFESGSIMGFNLSTSSGLSGTWNFKLIFRNPNQGHRFINNSLQVNLFKDYLPPLSTNDVPFFSTKPMNHSHLNFQFGLINRFVTDRQATKIIEEISTRRSVTFGLEVSGEYYYLSKVFLVWGKYIDLSLLSRFCYPIEFVMSSNNVTAAPTYIAQSARCK